MILDRLYKATAKDYIAGLTIDRWMVADLVGLALANATVSVNLLTCPSDRAYFVLGITVRSTPGAGQTVARANANITRVGNTLGAQLSRTPEFAIAAAQQYSTSFVDPGFILLPGEILQISNDFSAGGVANTTFGMAWGVSVPRANIQAN